MNIETADYGLVIEFGTREDFELKLQMNGQTFDDVVNLTDKFGTSLLGRCLVSRKFDLAKEFLEKNAKVNVLTVPEGFNEFHLIAANIRYEGALEVAKMLLDRGTSLMARDKKYGNTAFFTLCVEIFRVRTPESLEFLERCFEQVHELDTPNKAGFTIRNLLNRSGTDNLKRMMEEKE